MQAFGLDGIQYMIIRGIVPEIMHRANDILAAMTGGKMAVDIRTEREQRSTKQVVNSLDVWINSISGSSRPYQSHSGGEKVKIALAVTLGLADIKARRAGIQLGMLFIDEPPFLDAEGTEAYADALSSMAARNPGMRILAISHDPTMKARFPQNITVPQMERVGRRPCVQRGRLLHGLRQNLPRPATVHEAGKLAAASPHRRLLRGGHRVSGGLLSS